MSQTMWLETPENYELFIIPIECPDVNTGNISKY